MGWAEKRRNLEGGSRWQHLTEPEPTPRSDTLSQAGFSPHRAHRPRRDGHKGRTESLGLQAAEANPGVVAGSLDEV